MKEYKETCYEHKGYMITSIPGDGKKEWVIDNDMFTKPVKTSDGRHFGIAQIMYFRLKDAKAAIDRFQQTGTIIDELGGIVEKKEKEEK